MRQFDSALVAVNRLLEEVPSSTAYATRAAIDAMKGDEKDSIQDLDQAILREPTNSYLFLLQAVEFDSDGRFNNELADLKIASNLDPSNAAIQSEIAWAQFKLGRKQEAYKSLQRAIRLQPTYAYAYSLLGIQKSLDRAYPDALLALTTALKLIRGNTPPFGFPLANLPNSCPADNSKSRRSVEVSILISRADLFATTGFPAYAEQDSQNALQLDPSSAEAHGARSFVAEQMKDYQKALSEIDKAIELDSSEDEFRFLREKIIQEMKSAR